MSSSTETRSCPRCHSLAAGAQRFCRVCGTNMDTGDPSGELTRPRPRIRPLSRALIIVVVLICLAIGAALAVAVDNARDDGLRREPPREEVAGGSAEPISRIGAG